MYQDEQPLPRAAHAPGDAIEPAADPADAAPEGEGSADGGPLTADRVKIALRRVKDPEINMNIVDLGLIYDVVVEGNDVRVDMSLTSPGCPSGPEIMGDAQRQVETIEGLGTATINLVWSPPWTPDRIEPRVRAYLGF